MDELDALIIKGSVIGSIGNNNHTELHYHVPPSAAQPTPPPRGDCPYRGLDAFQEDDAAYFFGREEATKAALRELEKRLTGPGILVLSGASGAGKSSLLQAGVLPRLNKDGLPAAPEASSWPRLVFTPTAQPLDALATRVARLLRKDISATVRRELEMDPKGFALIAQEAVQAQLESASGGGSGRLIVVVDQFEQIFTACADEAQRRGFIEALRSAAMPQAPGQQPAALIVLGLRQDFERRCSEYPGLTEAIQHRYLLPPITGRQLRNVITGPAERAGIRIEEGLTEQLLEEIGARSVNGATGSALSPGVLPLLSHALYQTWRRRAHDDAPLTLSDYEQTGGIARAVELSATDAYHSLDEHQRRIARQVFVMLTSVTPDDMVASNPRTRADLAEGTEAGGNVLDDVLNAFARNDRRLLTLSDENVAIAHEVLVQAWPLLRDDWLGDDLDNRKVLGALQATAAEWVNHDHDSSDLYTGSRLEAAELAVAHSEREPTRFPRLPPDATAFLTASRQLERRHARRRRRVVAALSALVVALAASTGGALYEQNVANSQRDASASVAFAAQSQATLGFDPVLAAQMALASWGIEPGSPRASYSMLNTAANLQWNGKLGVVGTSQGWVTFSPNGRYLAIRTDDGVHLWDAKTRKELHVFPSDNANYSWGTGFFALNTMAFSPDSKSLYIVSDDNAGNRITQFGTSAPYRSRLFAESGSHINSVALSLKGGLLAADTDAGVQVWKTADKSELTQLSIVSSEHGGGSVAFSPGGRYLAVNTQKGVDLWSTSVLRSAGKPIFFSTGNSQPSGEPTFTSDNRRLAVAANFDETGGVDEWQVGQAAGEPIQLPDGDKNDSAYTATFSPDGSVVAAATDDGISLWGAYGHATLAQPADSTTYGVTFDPAGNILASLTGNGVWLSNPVEYLQSQNPRNSLQLGKIPADAVSLNPDGSLIAITYLNGAVRVENSATGQSTDLQGVFSFTPDLIYTAVFSLNGKIIAAATVHGIELWNAATIWKNSKPFAVLPGSQFGSGEVHQLAFSHQGNYLAAAVGNSVKVWNLRNSAQQPRSLGAPGGGIALSVAFSPNGDLLAVASDSNLGGNLLGDGAVREWNTGTFSLAAQIPPGRDPDYSLSFSPQGSLLAVAGNATTQLLDPATLQPAAPAISGTMTAFSPDGSVVAIIAHNFVMLRDIFTGTNIKMLSAPTGFDIPDNLKFSGNGHTLALLTAAPQNFVTLWNVSYLGSSLNDTVSYLCGQLQGQPLSPTEWNQDAPGVHQKNPCH